MGALNEAMFCVVFLMMSGLLAFIVVGSVVVGGRAERAANGDKDDSA